MKKNKRMHINIDGLFDFEEIAKTIGLGANGERFHDFVIGNIVLSTNNDYAKLDIARKNIKNPIEYYDFTEDDVDELFTKYDNNKLTRVQMSWHLLLLFSLIDTENIGDTPFEKAKISFRKELLEDYLDSTFSRDKIEKVREIFNRSRETIAA